MATIVVTMFMISSQLSAPGQFAGGCSVGDLYYISSVYK